jgi:hypothetical protein
VGVLGDYRDLGVIFVKPKLVDNHCCMLGLSFGISILAHDYTYNKPTFSPLVVRSSLQSTGRSCVQTLSSSSSNITVAYSLLDTAFQISGSDVI